MDRWVEDSGYSQGAMIVAATTKALTTFGTGFVDILRLGDGIRAGTLKGAGVDTLRFVAIFPFGKAAKTLKSVRGVKGALENPVLNTFQGALKRAKVIIDIPDPYCFWVASAKALTQISHKFKPESVT